MPLYLSHLVQSQRQSHQENFIVFSNTHYMFAEWISNYYQTSAVLQKEKKNSDKSHSCVRHIPLGLETFLSSACLPHLTENSSQMVSSVCDFWSSLFPLKCSNPKLGNFWTDSRTIYWLMQLHLLYLHFLRNKPNIFVFFL